MACEPPFCDPRCESIWCLNEWEGRGWGRSVSLPLCPLKYWAQMQGNSNLACSQGLPSYGVSQGQYQLLGILKSLFHLQVSMAVLCCLNHSVTHFLQKVPTSLSKKLIGNTEIPFWIHLEDNYCCMPWIDLLVFFVIFSYTSLKIRWND
jgi:hypothetical protein